MAEEMASMSLLITGKVQGVFYRASTQEQAQRLNLRGWVMNLPDGGVEVEAEGTKLSLESLVEWCKQGPPDARVDHVSVRWGPYRDEHRTFVVR